MEDLKQIKKVAVLPNIFGPGKSPTDDFALSEETAHSTVYHHLNQ